MKSLEDYAFALILGSLSLKTLESYHIRAIEIGILPEDLACRANTIIWDIKRLWKLYQDQAEGVLELVPDDFNTESIIETVKAIELKKARAMVRKTKEKS